MTDEQFTRQTDEHTVVEATMPKAAPLIDKLNMQIQQ